MTLSKQFSILSEKMKHLYYESRIISFLVWLTLSWLYACASQIIIPLPWNLVPLSLQPLPIFLATLLIGWPAVYAYLLYYIQGSLGAPFFAGMLGGMERIVGPTGGYLIGFGLSSIFLALVRTWKQESKIILLIKLYLAYTITFFCGLTQLSFFVPAPLILCQGFYPFIIGDLIIKVATIYRFATLKK